MWKDEGKAGLRRVGWGEQRANARQDSHWNAQTLSYLAVAGRVLTSTRLLLLSFLVGSSVRGGVVDCFQPESRHWAFSVREDETLCKEACLVVVEGWRRGGGIGSCIMSKRERAMVRLLGAQGPDKRRCTWRDNVGGTLVREDNPDHTPSLQRGLVGNV